MIEMCLKSFFVGGVFCLIGQILIMKTKLTSSKILVGYVLVGVVAGAIGIYKPLVDYAGAGATVPLTGFGYLLAKGALDAVKDRGFFGAFTGGVTATAAGISAAIFWGYIAAIVFKPKAK